MLKFSVDYDWFASHDLKPYLWTQAGSSFDLPNFPSVSLFYQLNCSFPFRFLQESADLSRDDGLPGVCFHCWHVYSDLAAQLAHGVGNVMMRSFIETASSREGTEATFIKDCACFAQIAMAVATHGWRLGLRLNDC